MSHTPTKVVAAIAVVTMAAAASVSSGASADPGRQLEVPEAFVTGQAAIDRGGDRLPEIAARYGLNPGELQRMLRKDSTLAMDRGRRLAYFDELEPADLPAQSSAATGEPTGNPFALSSLPGADKTIYLDFDGHTTTGTTWNSASGRTSIASPAYDIDGDTSSFNSTELDRISRSWAVVAEDFAPWNVNVTTVDPGADALRRSGSGDTRWGVRVIITGDDWNNCGCGGFAYLGSFDDTADEPVFVFNKSFTGVSEAISHEVGHALLLNHDGTKSGDTYYRGHDMAGTPGWAPIMGASYYEPVTQWSRQEYFDANNTSQDDTDIIGSLTNGNNFGPRADDHGDTAATATPLTSQQVSEPGIIETRSDVDVFSFDTAGGDVSFVVEVAAIGPNLDTEVVLRDSGGSYVAGDNLPDVLGAGFDAQVPAGSYTVSVRGVGVGGPSLDPPSGYTEYGSLGQYTLLGYVNGIGEPPPPPPPPPPPDTEAPAPPSGVNAVESDGDVTISWNANTEPDLVGYAVLRATDAAGPFSPIGSVGQTVMSFVDRDVPVGTNVYVVTASDESGNTSANSDVSTVVIAPPPPPPVDLTTHPTSDLSVHGSVSGSFAATTARGGSAQTVTEVDSGGKPNQRHDRLEHRWTVPASAGNQTLTIVASASGGSDADTGFMFEYSTNGTTWVPFTTVANNQSANVTASIGAPTGTVVVRVIDTDRTRRNTAKNSVTVDFIEIEGDGDVVQPPTASVTVATISTSKASAGRGLQYGVATVTVTDDLGGPVAGASVTVDISGDLGGSLTGITNSNGVATLRTTEAARKPSFSACVVSITGTILDYQPGSEAC